MNLPPLISDPALKKKAEEVRDLKAKQRASSTAVSELERTREDVEKADAALYAEAIRNGKKDPGQPALEEFERNLTAQKREAAALGIAAGEVESEFVSLVTKNEADLRKKIEKAIDASRQTYANRVQALSDAHDELDSAVATLRWLEKFPSKPYQPGTSLVRMVGLEALNGEPYRWDQVLAGLKDHGKPSRPREQRERIQLRQVA